MKNIFKELRARLFPKGSALLLFIIVTINMSAYVLAKIITKDRVHYDMTLAIDDKIPFIPFTIIIYLGCYLFWGVNYVLAVSEGGDVARRFACAEITGKLICFITYLVFPTTMVRADISGSGIFEPVLRVLYDTDAADNLFPSIHCYVSWYCYLGVKNLEKIPSWYKITSIVLALLVFISTLTIKQHVILDVIAGYLLAEATYRLWHIGAVKK